MKVMIQSINFDATEKLEEYVNKKAKKIEKFFDEIRIIDVYLKVIKPETATNKQAEIKVTAPNVEFFASKTCDTFEEAVDLALEAIEKQVIKFKEKIAKK
ncbi:MAG TPA: ribosome-associated translation inhibitor RaiA [Paludibacteraceae bacterium]|jgi:putative sigma-54 modulation protein|nr:ribosome-associated translation inhibitor RaiA [Paludibacteraceae bacterium]HPS10250.1 ribosome-associated translation inhibitor RaiA [Paludibacteraceae bacterium]